MDIDIDIDRVLQKMLLLKKLEVVKAEEAGEEDQETPSVCVDRAVSGSNAGKEMHKGKSKLRDKLAGLRRRRNEVKIVESDVPQNCRAEVNKAAAATASNDGGKGYEVDKLKKRRKGRRWSVVEEYALREGVEKYGKGNWKAIQTAYQDVFVGRTKVDLKDKWRNLMRK